MLDRVNQIVRALAGGSLLLLGIVSTASAQVRPNPPEGLSVDGETPNPTPLPSGMVFSDDFNYVVNKFDPAETKLARFLAAGYYVKDEATQPGRANGYLYTRASAPGCGAAPSGNMLTMEGKTTLGQTDFYLQLGSGTAGSIPARLYVQFDLCVSRSGAEMSHIDGARWGKMIYPLFGSRDGYPMATEDTAWLLNASSYAYRGSSMTQAPEPGAFTFMTQSNPGYNVQRATIEDQLAAGSGSQMTANVGDPWIRPNRWYTVRFLFDVSGQQGIHRVWVAPVGGQLALISDFTGGVTPGFTYQTATLDRLGAKLLRFPTTWGPASGAPQPDVWMNIDHLRIATSGDALN